MNYPRKDKTGFARWLPTWQVALGLIVAAGLMVMAGLTAVVYAYPVPQPNDVAIAQSTKVLYADGRREIGEIGDVRRTCVPLSDVPEQAQQAILAAEDQNFYDHGGFSIEGITRATLNNITGGDTQGGSTITQQYVKNAYLTSEQSIVRKVKELILSIKLETIESKEQILENYTCTIYWGRGGYGIQTASELYFGKDAKDLTLDESIALAAMIRSPENYEPTKYPERLQERMDYVAANMVEKGWITQAEADAVEVPDFKKRFRGNELAGQKGYLIEAVRQEMLAAGWTEAELEGGGLTIVTTIQKKAQDAAVQAVQATGPTTNTEGLRIGLAAVEPGTGKIRAMYGGDGYLKDQLNNATQARAQAGSTFKPFTLAAALEQGYGLNSMWDGSSPQTISGYTLENYANTNYGPVTLMRATTESINTAYVNAEYAVGVEESIDAANRAGLPKDVPGIEENLTFVLGTASPTPLEMAESYATFAARGMHADSTILEEVRRSSGEVAYKVSKRGKRVFDENIMDTLTVALQSVVNSGTATRASWIGRPAAGKTGTTDQLLSAWFVGYTPQLTTAVSLSKENEQGEPITLEGIGGVAGVTGGSFPTAIWAEFTKAALEGEPVVPFAPGDFGGTRPGQILPPPPPPPAPVAPPPSSSPSPSETKEPEETKKPEESEEAKEPSKPDKDKNSG